MLPPELVPPARTGIAWIEFMGAVVLGGFLVRALLQAVRDPRAPALAQRVAADGLIFSLNLKLAATVLKTLVLSGWPQIGTFALILAIRIGVKRQVVWQRRRDQAA